jgi:exodeoxyribonuclease VII small subunit
MDESKPAAFEAGLKRLEEIVRKLEAGEITLEESLLLFEEGTRLTRALNATLERAERTIEVLVRDASGALSTEPFEPEGKD